MVGTACLFPSMADCGICLEPLRSPVSVPCGHVHCERCIRGHINFGTDALKSTCPTCRKPFHIATPDFAFVPQKYHDFILPSVRKIYMDIPSVAALTGETALLNQRIESLVKENDYLRQHYTDYRERFKKMESDMCVLADREEDARQQAETLRKKYQELKRKFREVQSCDDEYSYTTLSQSSQKSDTCREIFPKEEEHPVSLQDLNPSTRRKRALPKSCSSNRMHCKATQVTKRQRIYRYSDIGPSNQTCQNMVKSEDEEDE